MAAEIEQQIRVKLLNEVDESAAVEEEGEDSNVTPISGTETS
ncbi:MAG: hypothetical protein U5O39_00685 [Gammaproteobacteria bacterium]|nr:hypothetical protein [Gammaproteobacteria bacterium]